MITGKELERAKRVRKIKRKNKEKADKNNNRIKGFFCVLAVIVLIVIFNIGIGVGLLRSGLFPEVQTELVTTAMSTLSHQYIAEIVASPSKVQKIMAENRVESNGNTDKNSIKVKRDKNVDKNVDKISLVNISGDKYKGYMLIVSNPKRIKLVTSKDLGKTGMKLNDMIKSYDCVGGMNAGGFSDAGGVGNGGKPTGIIIEDGIIKWRENDMTKYSIIGFDEDGTLILGNYTVDEMKEMEIKQAVSFEPYLVVNGEPTKIYGDGGWGINPRTAIGQRSDGTVLMLVIDGRQVGSIGVTIKKLQDIMLQYGAVNAANLDGGSSTVMYYNNKLINHPCSPYGERTLPSAFLITK